MAALEELINLDNFEDPRYARSRHVLTSPRSIRACHITGIAPRELLKPPLHQFDNKDGYANAYHRQQEQDHLRLQLLAMAKRERARIIRDEQTAILPRKPSHASQSNRRLQYTRQPSLPGALALATPSTRFPDGQPRRAHTCSSSYQRQDCVARAQQRKEALETAQHKRQLNQARRNQARQARVATRRQHMATTAVLSKDLNARVGPMAVQQRVEGRMTLQRLVEQHEGGLKSTST
eukprot:m.103769 g.103769  ORF g.103769 m.103769 type:complete len:236 (-) comp15231_c0_seq8:105-812(-)